MEKNSNVYIETYGCQMNVSDSEIVASVLSQEGFTCVQDPASAGIILVNTCSIRENAEDRVRKRLHYFGSLKKKHPDLIIGLLGCMAERTKTALMEEEKLLDLIAGPDAYRHLPGLLQMASEGQRAIDTILSADETYADISPVRMSPGCITAFISIMRGCENHCSYCVVPSTRGVERSRSADTILREATELYRQGYREVTLLGQNVNSYLWQEGSRKVSFAGLLEQIAGIDPGLRVRFATSHPKDLSEELLQIMSQYENLCKAIHLPVQSGSNRMLDRMNRKYTREAYLDRIGAIRRILPGCTLSTDIITGFCGETVEDHLDTLSLMKEVGFDTAFMFKYSQRPGTLAADTLEDDVPEEIKEHRLREIIDLQQSLSLSSNRRDIGRTYLVLAEGASKRSDLHLFGRTSGNKVVVFPAGKTKPGDYVKIRVTGASSATLQGEYVFPG